MSTLLECKNEFNKLVYDFSVQLAKVCPNSLISNNIKLVHDVLSGHPDKIVGLFILYVLPDKEMIESDNEGYFMEKTYKDVTGNESKLVSYVFEFKDIWKSLSVKNQNFVRQYMKAMCYYAMEYYKLKYGISTN